jgi:hypothetical protein
MCGACQIAFYPATKVRVNLDGFHTAVGVSHMLTGGCVPERQNSELLSLQWPEPPRNILLVKKDYVPEVTSSLVEFAK